MLSVYAYLDAYNVISSALLGFWGFSWVRMDPVDFLPLKFTMNGNLRADNEADRSLSR